MKVYILWGIWIVAVSTVTGESSQSKEQTNTNNDIKIKTKESPDILAKLLFSVNGQGSEVTSPLVLAPTNGKLRNKRKFGRDSKFHHQNKFRPKSKLSGLFHPRGTTEVDEEVTTQPPDLQTSHSDDEDDKSEILKQLRSLATQVTGAQAVGVTRDKLDHKPHQEQDSQVKHQEPVTQLTNDGHKDHSTKISSLRKNNLLDNKPNLNQDSKLKEQVPFIKVKYHEQDSQPANKEHSSKLSFDKHVTKTPSSRKRNMLKQELHKKQGNQVKHQGTRTQKIDHGESSQSPHEDQSRKPTFGKRRRNMVNHDQHHKEVSQAQNLEPFNQVIHHEQVSPRPQQKIDNIKSFDGHVKKPAPTKRRKIARKAHKKKKVNKKFKKKSVPKLKEKIRRPRQGNFRGVSGNKATSTTLKRYRYENEDGSITWGYHNDDGSFKEETIGADCITHGKYGYIDPKGEVREYSYSSGIRCDPETKMLIGVDASGVNGLVENINQFQTSNGRRVNKRRRARAHK